MIFRSKVDLWLVVVLLGASMAPLLVVASAFRDGAAWLPHVAVSLLMTAASLWLLTTTKYTVSDSEVLVQSGPLKWRLDVKSITSVAPLILPLQFRTRSIRNVAPVDQVERGVTAQPVAA